LRTLPFRGSSGLIGDEETVLLKKQQDDMYGSFEENASGILHAETRASKIPARKRNEKNADYQ
jgi:hypothetical protein